MMDFIWRMRVIWNSLMMKVEVVVSEWLVLKVLSGNLGRNKVRRPEKLNIIILGAAGTMYWTGVHLKHLRICRAVHHLAFINKDV